ncbi:MAG: DUF3108 domain-containing protein [bacterium]|nr:DUF3108 domain-containing protein [bacterium]
MRFTYTFFTSLSILISSCLPSLAAPFDAGERLEYSLTWGILPAGKTVMELVEKTRINGKEAFHATSVTDSTEAIAHFYSLNNRIDTYIDTQNFSTLKYESRTRENKREKHEIAIFNQSKKEVKYEKGGKSRLLKTASLMYDPISSIYYIRSLNLKPGEKTRLHTFDGGKLFTSDISFVKKEKISVKGVAYETIKLHSKTEETGESKKRKEYFIWLTANKARIPVMIKTKIKFGYIISELNQKKE